MELLKVDSLDIAIEKLNEEYVKSGHKLELEKILVENAFGRILAKNIVSDVSVPEFNRSTVDGYAVKSSDTQGANDTIPTFLQVVGESIMGEKCDFGIRSGECAYVPTGGMIPNGADSMVMVEYTEKITEEKIAIYNAVAEGQHVVKIGDDIKKGEIVLQKGTKVTSSEMGLLSSIGIKEIYVYKKWNATIISTGDELVESKDSIEFGKIRDVNTNLLVGLCIENNINVLNEYLVKDEPNILKKIVTSEMLNSDVVIISGGSSKGKKDASSMVIDEVTSSGVLTHGIAVKPGKPTITSYDKNTNTFVIGLPGHPVAAAMLFRMIVVNMYKRIVRASYASPLSQEQANSQPYGRAMRAPLFQDIKTCMGTMTENIPASPGRMTFQLVKVDDNYNVTPVYGRSGLINTIVKADGYIIIEENSEGVNKNEKVKVYYL